RRIHEQSIRAEMPTTPFGSRRGGSPDPSGIVGTGKRNGRAIEARPFDLEQGAAATSSSTSARADSAPGQAGRWHPWPAAQPQLVSAQRRAGRCRRPASAKPAGRSSVCRRAAPGRSPKHDERVSRSCPVAVVAIVAVWPPAAVVTGHIEGGALGGGWRRK